MEQRKVMSLGRSSFVISLPKHWIELNELKKGDVVSLGVQRDRSLSVYPGVGREKEAKEITLYVDPTEKEDSIVRSIIACYLNGYSCVKLTSRKIFSSAQQRAIRHIVRTLYMRIMESDAKSMHITTLIDESKASVVSSLHRMHLIANSMCRDAVNSLKDQDAALAKTVHSLDDDVDHFYFFLLRLLRSAAIDSVLANQLDLDPIDQLDYQTVVRRIEHVADHAANIANHITMLGERQQKIPDSLLKLMLASGSEAIDLYDKAVTAFFSRDIPACNEIIDRQKRIEELEQEMIPHSYLTDEKNALVISATYAMRNSIERIVEYAVDIAEITIDRSYEIPS